MESAIDETALKSHIKSLLPEYMVPNHFVALADFPRTPGGKTDRRALPIPAISGEPTAGKVPATALQEQILAVWSEVIGREVTGIDENFFDLGGHSLLVVSLVRKLNAKLGGKWKARDLFDAPTVEGLAALAGDMGTANGPEVGIQRRTDRSRAPLTSQQERLWFLHEMDPEKPLYNLVNLVRIEGPCETGRLRGAMKAFFGRHDIFRARIATADGVPYMAFADRADVPVEDLDLTGLDRTAAREALDTHLRKLVWTPMDFSRYPVVKATIARLSAQTHFVCLLVPHILSDGWSSDIILTELRDLFDHASDPSWSLPALAVDFGDYAAWERERRATELPSVEVATFWKEYLKGIPEAHDLPLDRPRPKEISGKGSSLNFEIEPAVTSRIHAVCEAHTVTPNMFFLACLAFLVRKYSTQETVVLGTPYANREQEEIRGVVGYFLRTIPLRFDVDEAMDTGAWLGYVKERFLSAWEHSSIGLDELVNLLEVPRTTNVNPIYQIMFIYQNYGASGSTERNEGAPRFTQSTFDRGVTENDIAMAIRETDRFEGTIDYSTDILDATSVEAFAANFARVARVLAEGFAGPLAGIDLMDARGRELVDRTNRTGMPSYLGRTFAGLFAESVDAHRDRPAMKAGGTVLTYGELDAATDGIARRLVAAGAEVGDRVGVYLERDRWLLPSLIGVWKAGAAYVPLDPHFPKDRLAGIVADAGIRQVVTTGTLEAGAAEIAAGLQTLRADEGEGDGGVALPAVGPEQTAYVLFTSGSTGKPKGVPIQHGALANLLLSMRAEPGMGDRETVLALTTYTFDISTLEFFLPLISGAREVVADYDATLDNQRLAALIEEEGVTYMQATPSRWGLLLDAGWRGRPGMTLLAGGEALPRGLAESLLGTGARVWNMYGPTETTVWSSVSRVASGDGTPVIGKPVANTGFHVLDRNGRPLPAGIPGELAISGAGLSEGYLNRPEQTTAQFVVIGDRGTARRIYKTGDLVQQLHTGDFRYLGRNDFQVKIRGFRIELGEIEAVMLSYPGVREAVCAVWERTERDKRIVGYYRAEEAVEEAALKAHMRRSLPDYMLPGHFVAIDVFPRTVSGKTDRKALPPPEDTSTTQEVRPPATPLQERVLELWSEVLGREVRGIDENFFDIGGHSLLVVSLVRKMNTRFGGAWKLRDLFDSPTVEGMAALGEDASVAAVPESIIQPRADRSRAPLSSQQERLWIVHEMDPDKPQYNLVHVVRIEGHCEDLRLSDALRGFFDRHDLFRAYITASDNVPSMSFVDEARVPVEEMDLTGMDAVAAHDALDDYVRDLARTTMDFSLYPVARAAVVRFPGETRYVCLLVPHIFSDGWSSDIFLNELRDFYDHAGDRSWEPPALGVDFGDYASWERQHRETGQAAAKDAGFWKEYLRGIPEAHDLPLDHPRPEELSGMGSSFHFDFDPEVSTQIRAVCEANSVTPNMFFLACFAFLVRKYSSQETVVIGTPYANREQESVRGLFGYFIRTIPLRFDVDGTRGAGMWLTYVKDRFLSAWEHSSIGFDELVSLLSVTRRANVNPIYQILFAFQSYGTRRPDESIDGQPRFTQVPFDHGVSENDLALYMWETDRFKGAFAYSTDLFDAGSIEVFAANFERVARALSGGTRDRLDQAELVDARGRKLVDRTSPPGSPSDRGRGVELRADAPPVPGARLGKDPQGNPAWFIPDPSRQGKYIKLEERR